jgi:riboflavin synthase alpha subunit
MRSLNEIALSGVCLTSQLDEMLEQIDMHRKALERAKEIEHKRAEDYERAQRASERTQDSQLPHPD